jgi:hypothetical protein
MKMSNKLFIPAYWPIWDNPSKFRRFDYTAIDGSMPPLTCVFCYDRGLSCMKLLDYDAHLTLKDIWYYDYRPGLGISEFRDDYPESGKKVVMDGLLGYPILWGEWLGVGENFISYPKMNPVQSWPPAAAKGVQIVVIEEHLDIWTNTVGTYSDVIVYTYMQAWDGKPGGGARYWAANGIGPVSLQWIAQDPADPYGKPIIQTSRMDSVITEVGKDTV